MKKNLEKIVKHVANNAWIGYNKTVRHKPLLIKLERLYKMKTKQESRKNNFIECEKEFKREINNFNGNHLYKDKDQLVIMLCSDRPESRVMIKDYRDLLYKKYQHLTKGMVSNMIDVSLSKFLREIKIGDIDYPPKKEGSSSGGIISVPLNIKNKKVEEFAKRNGWKVAGKRFSFDQLIRKTKCVGLKEDHFSDLKFLDHQVYFKDSENKPVAIVSNNYDGTVDKLINYILSDPRMKYSIEEDSWYNNMTTMVVITRTIQ